MAKTPSKKTAKTAKKASAEGKKKRKAKRTETFNTYLYKVRRRARVACPATAPRGPCTAHRAPVRRNASSRPSPPSPPSLAWLAAGAEAGAPR